ncbi:MAG: nucleotidyltransferase family protein [Burkholderiales bacterium]|nr:nucleotidyltransferase family protein [Anaerolineae bacterium]
MAVQVGISIPHEALADFCQRHHIRKLALFGSVLRDDFGPDSDIDVLVDFAPDQRPSLFELVDMKTELEVIFQREVDVIDWLGIERDPNYIRRQYILNSVQTIYER